MKTSSLKTKKATGLFSLASLIGGIIFLDPNITGNAIKNGKISHSPISFIGLALIICSIILALYTIKKLSIQRTKNSPENKDQYQSSKNKE